MLRSVILKSKPINRIIKRTGFYPVETSEYDYVIVGAGSAGCALAHYLAADNNKVALIENGPNYHKNILNSPFISVPLCLGYNMHNEDINYQYHTVPQVHLHNRKLYCPRGQIVGGSSSINGMVFVRGHPKDFDRWAMEGAEGWDFAHVLPYFKKYENCKFDVDEKYRGKSGPLRLSRAKEDMNKLVPYFLEACATYGLKKTDDFNGYSQYGHGLYDRTIDDGVRNDTYRAFIKNHPQIAKNITLIADRKVLHLEMKGTTVKGVVMRDSMIPLVEQISYARKEVILCGGAIESPKLLLLSGIGDAKHLKSVDISVVNHLPGVGANLQDHLEFYIQHKAKTNYTLHDLATSYYTKISAALQYMYNKSGPLSAAHLDAGAFLYTDPSVSHPDVQIHFFPYGVFDHGNKMPSHPVFQIHIGTLRAHSRGFIQLTTDFHGSEPLIDFNYLSDERDLHDLVKCVDIGRDILAQPALKQFSDGEISPNTYQKSMAEKQEYLKYNVESAYHPSCTCKMGADTDEMAVLDSQLRVRGIQNLRVVDASSFPSITSGNINAVVIMLATKAADLILGKDPLPPIDTTYK